MNDQIAPPVKPFRLGFVICEDEISKVRIRGAQEIFPSERVEVVAVAGSDYDLALRIAAAAGVPGAFSSLAEMIEACALDGVIVVLRATEQLKAVTYALDRGLHVFCEGPLGTSLEEARQMLDHAKKVRRLLVVETLFPTKVYEAHDEAFKWAGRWTADRSVPCRLEASARRAPGDYDRAGGLDVGWALMTELVAAGLPLLSTFPFSARARRLDRPLRNRFEVTVECLDEAEGNFVAEWGRGVDASRTEIRFEALGVDRLQVSFLPGEPEPEVHWPALISPELCRPELSVPKPVFYQQDDWVRACRRWGHGAPGHEAVLFVHEVLDAALRSVEQGGKEIWLGLDPR